MRALLAAKSPKLNAEQTEAVAKILLWCREMEVTFNIERGIGNDAVLSQLQKLDQKSSEMKFVSSLPFFVRGPPGTGKSTLVASLISVALKGHKAPMRTGERGILPTALRHVLVLAHTNAAVDELLVKVINSRKFKRSNTHEPLIRIVLQTTYDFVQSFTPGEIARSRSRNTGPVRGAARLELESKIVSEAEVVFATIGSLKRPEFLHSLTAFDIVILEEGAKIQDGDSVNALALSLGFKSPPTIGCPIPIFVIGDERPLAPYTGIDPNLAVKPILEKIMFERYVENFLQSGSGPNFCEPTLLRTQHRAHAAIADVFSVFACEGVVQTGRRVSRKIWTREKISEVLENASLSMKPVTIFQSDGQKHPDSRDSHEEEGGISNALKQNVSKALCQGWCEKENRLQKHTLALSNEIDVTTVDGAQGMERDIVIVSLARNRPFRQQSLHHFFNAKRRIKVLLSRGRERLVIIGAMKDIRTFCTNWDKIMTIVEAQKTAENEAIAEGRTEQEHIAFYNMIDNCRASRAL